LNQLKKIHLDAEMSRDFTKKREGSQLQVAVLCISRAFWQTARYCWALIRPPSAAFFMPFLRGWVTG